MHFTKPAWVMHGDSSGKTDSTKRLSIFSVHVHPDGSRIATGGLDAKVRIWSTKPILVPASEISNKPPKSLCTLSMHTGPVLCVRWAHSGRWLASGSDDEIVMIWDLDPSARGKVWGSDEINVEGWRPMKRLPGHESDVTDVAWSSGDRYLASVGLDSQVLVWCGYTLERLRKLDQHQGFVKGVCWDPVGEFLATQSDDRSVKIWRTTDWSLEAEVTKPFEDSPGSTFFRRLSWSPDGAHITASNATNNKGFVFIAAVITRNTWTSEISLVGHENTVEVAAYNPHIFLRNPNQPVSTSNICSVVALGADDRSVSVWQTKTARPLIVAKEVFERQIMDLNWSWDGLTLYAASSDGTIAVFNFEPDELEGIAPHSVQDQYLSKFGFVPPPIPKGYSHIPTQGPSTPSPSHPHSQTAGFDNHVNGSGGERVNMLVAKRNNKKRVGLTQVPAAANGATPMNGPKRASLIPIQEAKMTLDSPPHQPQTTSFFPSSNNQSFFPTPQEQPFEAPSFRSRHADIDMGVPIDAFDMSPNKGKRKASDEDEESRPVFRTLGGDRPRHNIPITEITSSGMASHSAWSSSSLILPTPAVLTRSTTEVDGTDCLFESTNSEETGLSEVSFLSGKQTLWLDYLPSPALSIKATSSYCAVAMQDGSVNVYSHTGRRIMPNLSLGSPCSFLDGVKNSLLVITASGQVYSWAVNKQASFFPPVSIAPLLSPNVTISSATTRANGCPIFNFSNGVVFSYDPQLSAWVKITDRWWSNGSDFWPGRQRSSAQSANRGVLNALEASVSESPDESAAEKPRPSWWGTALTLGHLETRLLSAKLLDSPSEYKQALLLYSKKIADEGFRAKAEELIKELCGPVYWRSADEQREVTWSPYVAGLSKRDLLKDVVLAQFVRSKTLTKLAMDYQDLLKKIATASDDI
ncbi:histone transcription regulator 1 [Armillaria fumosa]|nr:histone transcription regulator 1 [Armillaria fumosa]